MTVERKVAIAVTISVTTSVRRVLQIELREDVLAQLVVPSRCADEGPAFWPPTAA